MEREIDENGMNETSDADKNDRETVDQADSPGSAYAHPDPLDVGDVSVGDDGPVVVVEDFSRVDIVQYAGASGDFNRIHVDEPYAREAGNPSVFAHGMFTAGVAAQVVADWVGLRCVDTFGVRFTSRVWPQDTLTATGEIIDVEANSRDTAVSADVRVVNQNDTEVLTGHATATFPDQH